MSDTVINNVASKIVSMIDESLDILNKDQIKVLVDIVADDITVPEWLVNRDIPANRMRKIIDTICDCSDKIAVNEKTNTEEKMHIIALVDNMLNSICFEVEDDELFEALCDFMCRVKDPLTVSTFISGYNATQINQITLAYENGMDIFDKDIFNTDISAEQMYISRLFYLTALKPLMDDICPLEDMNNEEETTEEVKNEE